MPLPKIEELFNRTRRSRLFNLLDIPHLFLCLVILGLHVMLLTSGRFERIENSVLDFFFRHRQPLAVHSDIVLIEINQESLQTIGAWPWPWSYHVKMVEILKQWEAKAVVFDFPFTGDVVPEEEEALVKPFSENKGIYLPVSLETKTGKKFWIHSMTVVLEPDQEKKGWIHSAASLEQSALGLGHRNLMPDEDGVIRRVQPYLSYASESYFYLPLKVAYDHLKKEIYSILDLGLPLDESGNFLINWAGNWKEEFKHYAYSDLVRSAQAMEKGMDPVIRPENIKGKICLIGVSAPEAADFVVTPRESRYPALGIQANVLNSALTREFIVPTPKNLNVFYLCMIGFVASVLFVVFGNILSFITALALGFIWAGAAYALFIFRGIWVYSFHPLFLILSLFVCSAIYHQFRSKKERARLFTLATRDGLTGLYVIRHFRDILNRAAGEAKEKKANLSVILLDIDNFKKINDTYGHPAGDMVLKKTAEVIHSCFRSKRPLHLIDFAARYGGEEFIVMLRDARLRDAAFNVAERIRKAVERTRYEWEGTIIPVTISLGVATLHADENVPDVMVRRADEALYRAKKSGKNCVCIETFATG